MDLLLYHEGMHAGRVEGLASSNPHCTESATMICTFDRISSVKKAIKMKRRHTLHGDDVLSSGEDPGHFDGRLDCFGSRIPEEEGVE